MLRYVPAVTYYALRCYGVEGQIGQEVTLQAYVDELVAVFREVRRIMKPDAIMFLNLGDTYAANRAQQVPNTRYGDSQPDYAPVTVPDGLKPKDMMGVPWRVAFALQADGWWLRSDIIWQKPNALPGSYTDRPTSSYEHLFLLAKSATYYYDAEAIMEPLAEASVQRNKYAWNSKQRTHDPREKRDGPERPAGALMNERGRNKRDVWSINTQGYGEDHFAAYPEALVEPCVLAGSKMGDVVFDPFLGRGTTGVVAVRLGRRFLGVELNPNYAELARRNIGGQSLNLFSDLATSVPTASI